MTNQLLYADDACRRLNKLNGKAKKKLNNRQFVIHPINSLYQRTRLNKRNLRVEKFVSTLYPELPSKRDLNIIAGCVSKEAKRDLDNDYKIFTYPLPEQVRGNLENYKTISVYEQGDPYLVGKLQVGGGEYISHTGEIPDHSRGYIRSSYYEKMFTSLKKKKATIIGDLGEYTMDNLGSINACLCFGSSSSVALGTMLAGSRNVFSITGDAAFMHSGKNVIPEAVQRGVPLNIIVICNGGSQGTGGQVVPGNFPRSSKYIQTTTVSYNDTSVVDFGRIFKFMYKSKKVSILYLQI